jgi:hypothetical protein
MIETPNNRGKQELELNSDTLFDAIESGELPVNPGNGLVDGVFLMGGTTTPWRDKVIDSVLTADGRVSYNPMMNNWNPELHPKAESLGMEKLSVLGIYVDLDKNKENVGLGSLFEIGIAIYSARLRGQRVVVAFAEGYENNLTEPGARAQYMLMKQALERVASQNPDLVTYMSDAKIEDFGNEVIKKLDEQRDIETQGKPITREALLEWSDKRRERIVSSDGNVVIGGSSKAYSEALGDGYTKDQIRIEETLSYYKNIIRLNAGENAENWDHAYETGEYEDFIKVVSGESDLKTDAMMLLWMIKAESLSKGAAGEIGFMLLNALENPQQFCLLLEPFDWRGLARERMPELEAQLGRSLDEVGLGEWRKMEAVKSHKDFEEMDGVIRVRSIASAQLNKLLELRNEVLGATGVELFAFARDLTDYDQKINLIKDPESYAKREKYFANIRKFTSELERIIVQDHPTPETAVEAIQKALDVVVPREVRNKLALTKHLNEAGSEGVKWVSIIAESTDEYGRTYLNSRQMELFSNYAAPIHDLMKWLGTPDMQSMSDHENMIGYVVATYFGEMGMSKEDVEFLTKVVGDHENIFKEEGRRGWALSQDPAERAKALFFVADVLTGVTEMHSDGVLRVNLPAIRERFTDLYFRHIEGKVFRPEWGVAAVSDLIAFFSGLEDRFNINTDHDFYLNIVDAALAAIDEYNPVVKNEDQKNEVIAAYRKLEEIKARIVAK